MSATERMTLVDFQGQMQRISKIGSLNSVLKMIPGLGDLAESLRGREIDADVRRIDGIINAMTPWERVHPDGIDCRRCQRIARGSGNSVDDVEQFLGDFLTMAEAMARMGIPPSRSPRAVTTVDLFAAGQNVPLESKATPRWAKWARGLWWFDRNDDDNSSRD